MKAWILHDINDIRYEECEKPIPEDDEVLVKVKAAGICGSDIPRIYETGAHIMPIIPGHEFSGVVEKIGENVNTNWLSKRVGVFPLIPCGKCEPCKKGFYEMCRNYDYIGSRRNGAFAESVSVPAGNLTELPDPVSFEQGAMLEPMAVAVHAMRIGTDEFSLSKDRRITVCGLGTIGLLLTMFLLDAGYKNILVIGNKEFQRKTAMSLGIGEERYCDNKENDAALRINETGGSDLYFDCAGKNETACLGIDTSRPSGRVVLIGNPHSDMVFTRDVYWKILRKQLTLSGSWNSGFDVGGTSKYSGDDWKYAINRIETGSIHPENLITHRFSPDDLDKGLEIMRYKTEDYCKVMISSLS